MNHILRFGRPQVRVPDFDFIGCGEGGSKKDAQSLAAKSYCQFLVEQGLLDPSMLPGPLNEVVNFGMHSFFFWHIVFS